MARIIELDEYVPEDLQFNYRGQSLSIPGDLSVDDTFDLLALFAESGRVEESGDLKKQRDYNKKLEQTLLAMFRRQQPDLERLPFGQRGLAQVLIEVLILLGLLTRDVLDPPTRPASTPAPKKAKPRPRSRKK